MSESLRQSLLNGELAGSRYVLRTPRGLPAGTVGLHQGARAGSSLEFKEHRDYEPGDDLRHIDWNAYARSDQLSVKLFREEVTPHVDVVVDASRSMALEASAKAQATVALAAFFATADAQPPERGNLRFIDAETEQPWEMLVDDAAIERYRASLERHQQLWQTACRQAGAILAAVVAEDWLRDWRLDELIAAEFLQVM